MNLEQKYLKSKGMIMLIAVLNMVIPLSTDMYLSAIPEMKKLFETSESMVNFTLVGFYFFMAVGMLIFGPLSDKYGRKKLLIAGEIVYLIASGACAMTFSIESLILARTIEALGAGCVVAVSTALVKDCFVGKIRDNVLALVQAMMVIAPMAAPVLGAWIIEISGWRATFWILTLVGFFCLITSILMQETVPLEDRSSGSVLSSMSGLLTVAKNKGFTVFLLIAAFFTAPFMAYVAVSSYVYINVFSLSGTTYSYFFAINSAAAIIGPIVYVKLNGKVKSKNIVTFCLIATLVCGVLLVSFGWIAPIVFMLCFLPFTIIESGFRPLTTAVLLNQQEHDTGSASSLINFTHTIMGSLGMLLGPIWSNYIAGLGTLIIVFGVLSLCGWIYINRSETTIRGLAYSQD